MIESRHGTHLVPERIPEEARPGALLGDEWGAEIFYNYAITPSIQFTLDLQYIDSGVSTADNAFVVGLRLFTLF